VSHGYVRLMAAWLHGYMAMWLRGNVVSVHPCVWNNVTSGLLYVYAVTHVGTPVSQSGFTASEQVIMVVLRKFITFKKLCLRPPHTLGRF